MTQLADLSKPFPAELIQRLPGKGEADFVPHGTVKQRLLEVVGPYSFEVVEVVNDTTVRATLSCAVDGVLVRVTELGTSENQQDLLKSAASDAFKRCCAHVGLGLHLWSPQRYWLHKALTGREDGGGE